MNSKKILLKWPHFINRRRIEESQRTFVVGHGLDAHFATLTQAIRVAEAGDTLLLAELSYFETLRIQKSITIKSIMPTCMIQKIMIDVDETGGICLENIHLKETLIIKKGWVLLKNVQLLGKKCGLMNQQEGRVVGEKLKIIQNDTGVWNLGTLELREAYITGSQQTAIKNGKEGTLHLDEAIIADCEHTGIMNEGRLTMEKSSMSHIKKNSIVSLENSETILKNTAFFQSEGVQVVGDGAFKILDSTFTHGGEIMIWLGKEAHGLIDGNTFRSVRGTAVLLEGHGELIENLFLQGEEVAVKIEDWAMGTIRRNRFIKNQKGALLVHGEAYITQNIFENNKSFGIKTEKKALAQMIKNTFLNNGEGHILSDNAIYKPLIENNYFRSEKEASEEACQLDNDNVTVEATSKKQQYNTLSLSQPLRKWSFLNKTKGETEGDSFLDAEEEGLLQEGVWYQDEDAEEVSVL